MGHGSEHLEKYSFKLHLVRSSLWLCHRFGHESTVSLQKVGNLSYVQYQSLLATMATSVSVENVLSRKLTLNYR